MDLNDLSVPAAVSSEERRQPLLLLPARGPQLVPPPVPTRKKEERCIFIFDSINGTTKVMLPVRPQKRPDSHLGGVED